MKISWIIGPPVDMSKVPPAVTLEGYPAKDGETARQYQRRIERALLPNRASVVTHAGMGRFKITKDKLRDFGLVAVLLAGLALWAHSRDQEAVAKGDYWACHSQSCRDQVEADSRPSSDGIPDIKH
jgi:hypothetical protein